MEDKDFETQFEQLTGFVPLPWQHRLFDEYFNKGEIPAAVDIPTGLGKTAIIALWLIAVRSGTALPRRLIYVVDRRAVVDQATDFVLKLRENSTSELPISTLRGQHADNREWLDDPATPAIVIGTVDMIGSRLLFEGYGVSRKMRPYHAGMLGNDSLIVLDEAHLVPAFEALITDIEGGEKAFGASALEDRALIPRLRLISLSATARRQAIHSFQLTDKDLGKADSITRRRLSANKTLSITDANASELPEQLATTAWKISEEGNTAMRCMIYCNSRDQAEKVFTTLEKLIKQNPKDQATAIAPPQLFVGARRGHERDLAAADLEELGFLAGNSQQDPRLRFLIATSAGEVGVDLDADHMVCDLVSWERMVQRFGRVNRRGDGAATIQVIDAGPLIPKGATTVEKKHIEAAHHQVRSLLESLPKNAPGAQYDEGYDASPGALHQLKSEADASRRSAILQASSPLPLHPKLLRAELDAWSMTSLREHTGRPEVVPWLRGWIDEDPQTSMLWRTHLPIPKSGTDRKRDKSIEDFFEAAPPHISENLKTETYRVSSWLLSRSKRLLPIAHANRKNKDEERDYDRDALTPELTIAIALNRTGDLVRTYSLSYLAEQKNDRLQRELAGRTLVLDHRIGGLSNTGLLDTKENNSPIWLGDNPATWDQQERNDPNSQPIKWRLVHQLGETNDPFKEHHDWRQRHQLPLDHDKADGEISESLIVYKHLQDATTENDRSFSSKPQLLSEHQRMAEQQARSIGQRMGLPDAYQDLLALAARLHDEGKKAELWQRAFNARRDGEIYAKTKGPVNVQLLDGYRHELGSLLDAEKNSQVNELPKSHRDLVLHLIAAHHGNARPLISASGCDQAPPSQLHITQREIAQRFARLQKQWGPWGLAWWELLLRAADQQASKRNEQRVA